MKRKLQEEGIRNSHSTQNNQIEEEATERTRSNHRENKNAYKNLLENLKERENLGDLSANGRIIL
jgi:hypothetical protein